jgi:hypothetical protein
MNKQELRLGNYIFSKETNSIQKITGITEEHPFFDAITFDYPCWDEIEPIKLTKDILYKLGFIKDGIWFNYSFGFYGIGISNDPSGFNFSYDDGFILIEYVHELQNLIFSLSGSDLQLAI